MGVEVEAEFLRRTRHIRINNIYVMPVETIALVIYQYYFALVALI